MNFSNDNFITLGIESSCDDTAVAIVRGRDILGDVISSQEHSRFGGVVPEFAARMHQTAILPLIEKCINDSKIAHEKIDLIAVTDGPGLMGSLLVGVLTARALSMTWNIPAIGVNHIEGHIFANTVTSDITPPFLSLVVSGGHTEIVRVDAWGDYKILGHTRDDAAGEAFDKGAKLLGLGYPGGAVIDKLSATGNDRAFDFPVPLKNTNAIEFSFSGLKTALLWKIKEFESEKKEFSLNDICASYQRAIVESLMSKLDLAVKQTGIFRIGVSGGVAANGALRAALGRAREEKKWEIFIPPPKYCTDNAVMIAAAGANAWLRGVRNTPTADPSRFLC